MSSAKRRIPDAVLEFYLASLLDEPARAQVETSLAQSAPDRARLEALRADSEALLLKHPAAPMAARVGSILEQRKQRRRWWALAVPTLAGACIAALLWVQVPSPREELGTGRPNATGLSVDSGVDGIDRDFDGVEDGLDGDYQERPKRWHKGTESIAFQVRHASNGVELQPDDLFTPSEPLVLEAWANQAGYVAVLVQERGVRGVRARSPSRGVNAVPGAEGFIVSVPFTLEGVGEVFVLFFEQPFSLEPVLRAVEEGRQVEDGVPKEVKVFSRVLRPRGAP